MYDYVIERKLVALPKQKDQNLLDAFLRRQMVVVMETDCLMAFMLDVEEGKAEGM